MRLLLLMLSGLLLSCPAQAQGEGYHWAIGNGFGLHFGGAATTVDSGYQALSPHIATISDASGQLLLYTDGAYAWNGQHELINSTPMIPINPEWVLMVPQPGSSRYYIFSSQTQNGYSQAQYAVIDMAAQGGKGAVVQSAQIFSTTIGQDWTLAAQGFCEGNTYWIVLANPSFVSPGGIATLKSYRLDAAGLDLNPVTTLLNAAPFPTLHAFGIRFSLKGDKIAFFATGITTADFDPQTGQFSHFQQADATSGAFFLEFSPNGRYLYAVETLGSVAVQGDSLYSRLYQYDLQAGGPLAVQNSKALIYQGKPLQAPQTGPDGRIYIPKAKPDLFTPSYSVIKSPDLPGIACQFVPDDILLPNIPPNSYATWSPLIPNHLFSPGLGLFKQGFAGNDTSVCSKEALLMGKMDVPGYTYAWTPGDFLGERQQAQTFFLYPFDLYEDSLWNYTLEVQGEGCTYRDTVQVRVRRSPLPLSIQGSRVVCPLATETLYRIDPVQDSVTYFWTASGGSILAGQGTDSLLVNWGSDGTPAFVEVIARLPNGCEGDPVRLPVRISPELSPDMPFGPAELCAEFTQSNAYQISVNGASSYTWGIAGGSLSSGPQPGQVLVNWNGTGLHSIWVEEVYTSTDTVCYGLSDTLFVEVFTDTSFVQLLQIGTVLTQEADIQVDWQALSDRRPLDSLLLWRRHDGIAWQEIARFAAGQAWTYLDRRLPTDSKIFDYQISSSNECRSDIRSGIHRNILLEGSSDTANNDIFLQWTAYVGWPVRSYEVLRRLENESNYTLIRSLPPDSLDLLLHNGLDAFRHRLRIRATGFEAGQVSLSNEVEFRFGHPIFIPNVFTPNGDGIHDRWVIENLVRYPQNELRIYDRWGSSVFAREGYRNDWDGDQLPEGVYFYHFSPGPGMPLRRGSLTLLR